MQNTLRSVIHFDDFVSYFGPKGVVAMSWWLGAVHAARIRQEQDSFPFLQLIGGNGFSRNLLLNYLQKLSGQTPYAYSMARATKAARARLTAMAADRRVVIFEQDRASDRQTDWDELKPLYSNCSVITRPGYGPADALPFLGAVTISSDRQFRCSDAVRSRVVLIDMSDDNQEATKARYEALSNLDANKAIGFDVKVCDSEQRIFSHLHDLVPQYRDQLIGKYGAFLRPRTARNCGQLLALLDVLGTFIPISEDLRDEAKKVISEIAFRDTLPF